MLANPGSSAVANDASAVIALPYRVRPVDKVPPAPGGAGGTGVRVARCLTSCTRRALYPARHRLTP